MHRLHAPIGRMIVTAALCGAAIAGLPSALLGQGSLSTSDGLTLSLGSTGVVSSLKSGGVEYGSSGLKSGLMYRELPATVPNVAPNGSFELGSTSPSSWTWTNNSAGSWALDTTVKFAGTRSMKTSIAGTTAQKGPVLTSSTFTILPNATYTLTFRAATSGVSGGLTVFVMEQRSDGTVVQPHTTSAAGTTGWTLYTIQFTTAANAVTAYLKAQIYSGYGTAWLDDIQLSDVFGGRLPVAFGGTVTSDTGGLTQTSSVNGLNLNARFTNAGTAIRVDATLTDTTGQDRAVEVSFRLPLDVVGWNWEEDFLTPSVIQDGVRYENVDFNFSRQGRSFYPFATVHNGVVAFSLAVPMGPQMQRFGYDTVNGLRSTWDLGLSAAATKTKSKASWTFWIYSGSGRWGFRGAAQKYYSLNAASFTTPVKLQGAWVLPATSVTTVSGFQDFGWGIQEGGGLQDLLFDNQNGILVYNYLDPSGWFREFPDYAGGPQPPYDVIISALNSDATSGTGTTTYGTPVQEMAQAVINSSPYNDQGQYLVTASYYFWYKNRLQVYPFLADPDIPAPSMWSVLKKYGVDGRIATWQGAGGHLDGIFLDDLTYLFTNKENYRRALWAYSDVPLSFSYTTRKVVQYDGFATAEFCKGLHSYLNSKGLGLMGSSSPVDLNWIAPWLDILGGEVVGAESLDKAYMRRTLYYGKSWSNLYISTTTAPTAADVLTYFRQALLLGYYPGFNGSYWSNSTLYERDRAVFKQYMPLIKTIIQAGWRPIPYATPSDAAIRVERFDDQVGNTFYLTAQNSSTTTTKTFQMTVDGASLDASSGTITLTELVGNTTLSASRSGSNILFSDTLAPGETALYKITVASTTTLTATIPSNGDYESGTTSPSGWTLGVSLTNGSWSWDPSVFHQGSHSTKLAVSGTLDLKSPILKSANFALSGGTSHTLSAWTMSSNVGGTYPPKLWLVEADSSGNVLKSSSGASIQHSLSASTGSTSWLQKSVTFTTDPRCAQAYVYASIYKGYGTVWLDDVLVK